MATIKSINFSHVGRKEGTLCDRCGQYIQNIATVKYAGDLTLNYGLDCFNKLASSGNLSNYGKKLFKGVVNEIKRYEKELEDYKSGKINAENDKNWYWISFPDPDGRNRCAYGSYEEFKEYQINELLPFRIEKAQKELEKFSKVNFKPYEDKI